MREIKFRGKMIDHNLWTYGDHHTFYDHDGMPYAYAIFIGRAPFGYDLVIPETIGQYTGLKDKNGTEIYDGDIIEIEIPMTHPHGAILATFTAVVEWVNDGFYAMEIGVTDPVLRSLYGHSGTHCRIIGNIHDNPELLKGGKQI